MNRPRIVRWLRFAWTAFWGIAAVLLIALWVRSYWWADRLYVPLTDRHTIAIGSILGGVTFAPWVPTAYRIDSSQWFRSEKDGEPPPGLVNRGLSREKLALIAQHEGMWAEAKRQPRPIRFGILNYKSYFVILSPYIVLVGGAGVFSVLPWFHWRFSVRTLLITTTLVAVGLWLIVWLTR
jgi:hypothetical protein